MEKKKVIVLDRSYSVKYMNSEVFDTLIVSLSSPRKQRSEKEGLKVIACFEDEYERLPIAEIPDNYLIHSLDSDRFLRRYDYSKRMEILGKEISFWTKIFDTYQPDCIVNEIVTIEFMEVMAIEAAKRNIPYYRWGGAPFYPKDIWVKDRPFNSLMGKEYWQTIEETAEDKTDANNYIEEFRVKHRRPYYIKKKRTSPIKRVIKKFSSLMAYIGVDLRHYTNTFTNRFCYEDYYYLRRLDINYKWSRLLHNEYDHIDEKEKCSYLFYPLHLEPEATIEYMGFFFNSQKMILERIAHSLKLGQKLIVKEHPQQEGMLMTKEYRDLKKRYPNLIYLPGHVSAYDIYPHIKCLVTLNGTAGFESWICKRPVIVLGDVFYRDFPGVTACDDFKQLYDIIRNERFEVANEDEILSYVAKICHQLSDIAPCSYDSEGEKPLTAITKQIEHFLSK